MTTRFPDNYDVYSVKIDNVTDIRAADINDLQDAVNAIENELGANVAGLSQPSGWNLANRLGVFVNDNGTFKAGIITASDIPSGSISNTKIYHNDTFEFKSVKAGRHIDGTYGYTGSGPGTMAGVTIDAAGNVFIDGNLTVRGAETVSATETLISNLQVDGSSYLGNAASDIVEITGTTRPAASSLYDLGDPTHRFKTAYIDVLLGQSTGGDVLTVATSGTFDNTIAIKSSTDTSSGDSLAFIGLKSGDLVIQSATGQNLLLQPYEGKVMINTDTPTSDLSIGGNTYMGGNAYIDGDVTITGTLTAASTAAIQKIAACWDLGTDAFVSNGVFEILIPYDITITQIIAYADTAPTGADLLIDVLKNGTTIFTDQSKRTKIVDGNNASDITTGIPDIAPASAGDRIRVDISQVGATIAGGNHLTVTLYGGVV